MPGPSREQTRGSADGCPESECGQMFCDLKKRERENIDVKGGGREK